MRLPFTPEQFFGVFAKYNEAVWPAQVAIYIAAAIVYAAEKREKIISNLIV